MELNEKQMENNHLSKYKVNIASSFSKQSDEMASVQNHYCEFVVIKSITETSPKCKETNIIQVVSETNQFDKDHKNQQQNRQTTKNIILVNVTSHPINALHILQHTSVVRIAAMLFRSIISYRSSRVRSPIRPATSIHQVALASVDQFQTSTKFHVTCTQSLTVIHCVSKTIHLTRLNIYSYHHN